VIVRLRTALLLTCTRKLHARFAPYLGAAWEHEFGGDAKYSVHNITAGSPSLDGSTGVFELGISVKADNMPVSLDFGIETYLGIREGVSAKIQIAFEF